jgi:cytochrome c553
VACHGPVGVGITPMFPTLAGQHADYLTRALLEYKHGGRKNPIMKTFADQLNEEQIAQLAAYYSQQQPALKTEERPSTRFQSGH